MPKYVDGFVVPVLKKKLKHYFKIAQQAGKVWRDHGALDYKECLGDDLTSASAFCMPFPKGIRLKTGETVVFSFIVYKSKAHRDKVNAKVMKDPRLAQMCDPKNTPFDCKRMLYGGFKVMVDA
jgi:uncharacterized protein YbaA (DUF1428 family)